MADVHTDKECVFEYCPHPVECKRAGRCLVPKVKDEPKK